MKKFREQRKLYTDDVWEILEGIDNSIYEGFSNMSDEEKLEIGYNEVETSFSIFEDELNALNNYFYRKGYAKFIAIADLGLWSGRRKGYKLLDSLEEITSIFQDNNEVIVDKDGLHISASHHDGTNYVTIYLVNPNKDIEKFCDMVYDGEEISEKQKSYYVKNIAPYICDWYGFRVKGLRKLK